MKPELTELIAIIETTKLTTQEKTKKIKPGHLKVKLIDNLIHVVRPTLKPKIISVLQVLHVKMERLVVTEKYLTQV